MEQFKKIEALKGRHHPGAAHSEFRARRFPGEFGVPCSEFRDLGPCMSSEIGIQKTERTTPGIRNPAIQNLEAAGNRRPRVTILDNSPHLSDKHTPVKCNPDHVIQLVDDMVEPDKVLSHLKKATRDRKARGAKLGP